MNDNDILLIILQYLVAVAEEDVSAGPLDAVEEESEGAGEAGHGSLFSMVTSPGSGWAWRICVGWPTGPPAMKLTELLGPPEGLSKGARTGLSGRKSLGPWLDRPGLVKADDDDEEEDGAANWGRDEDEAGKLDMYLLTSAWEGVNQGWKAPGAQPMGGLSPSQGVIR